MSRTNHTGCALMIVYLAGIATGVFLGYSYALQILLCDQQVVSMFIGQEVGFVK